MIAIAKRGEANKELLTIENTNKITIVENAKMSNIIDFNSKYYQAISNMNIDAARNLGLIDIKKYQKYAS